MTEPQARQMLNELVRLKGDVERYQRALGALGFVQEVRSSAADQLSRLAFNADQQYRRLQSSIVKILCGAPDMLSSIGDHDPAMTNPRV